MTLNTEEYLCSAHQSILQEKLRHVTIIH